MAKLIEMKGIGKIYNKGENELAALSGINLSVDMGEFLAIVGASGSGKSTLMNIIGCLDKPSQGVYLLDGIDTSKFSSKMLDDVRRRKIGFIFQKFCLIPTLSAIENVELPLIYSKTPSSIRRQKAISALETVGLSERMDHRPNELSGGQQQRVAIARAIVGDPQVILADEPTGNLDSKSGKTVMNLLCRLHEIGKTIVMITHDESVANMAQRRVTISDGKII